MDNSDFDALWNSATDEVGKTREQRGQEFFEKNAPGLDAGLRYMMEKLKPQCIRTEYLQTLGVWLRREDSLKDMHHIESVTATATIIFDHTNKGKNLTPTVACDAEVSEKKIVVTYSIGSGEISMGPSTGTVSFIQGTPQERAAEALAFIFERFAVSPPALKLGMQQKVLDAA